MDVLVNITTNNICGSDLQRYEGRTYVETAKSSAIKVLEQNCRRNPVC